MIWTVKISLFFLQCLVRMVPKTRLINNNCARRRNPTMRYQLVDQPSFRMQLNIDLPLQFSISRFINFPCFPFVVSPSFVSRHFPHRRYHSSVYCLCISPEVKVISVLHCHNEGNRYRTHHVSFSNLAHRMLLLRPVLHFLARQSGSSPGFVCVYSFIVIVNYLTPHSSIYLFL